MTPDAPTKFERFDSKSLKTLRDRLEDLMGEHGFEGIELAFGDITFTEGDAHITTIARIKGGKTREYRSLERAAEALGLDLARVVDGMRLVGYVRRRRAYPFITEDEEGNRFKMMTSAAVRNYSRESEQIEEIIPEAAIQSHSDALDGSLPRVA